MYLNIKCHFPDIQWTKLANSMQSHRYYTSSAEAGGRLYILGGGGSSTQRTTEYLDFSTLTWKSSFGLSNRLFDGCAVKLSHNEIIVIFGEYEPNLMYKYNVVTGHRTKLATPIIKAHTHLQCFV